jgi:hypothetical protein
LPNWKEQRYARTGGFAIRSRVVPLRSVRGEGTERAHCAAKRGVVIAGFDCRVQVRKATRGVVPWWCPFQKLQIAGNAPAAAGSRHEERQQTVSCPGEHFPINQRPVFIVHQALFRDRHLFSLCEEMAPGASVCGQPAWLCQSLNPPPDEVPKSVLRHRFRKKGYSAEDEKRLGRQECRANRPLVLNSDKRGLEVVYLVAGGNKLWRGQIATIQRRRAGSEFESETVPDRGESAVRRVMGTLRCTPAEPSGGRGLQRGKP